ncbi:MAG: sigma-70 family RNA polymerase sigma factor [Gemmatimonadaceae bacterium]|nr:sigma-70 family RNA polymerase sigma factor [Gemmatimonadaceae bacterium]
MDEPKRLGAVDATRSHLSLVTDGASVATANTAVASDAAEPLLPRIAAGDERAVAECVARYGPLIWSLARRWAPDTQDAEDAVQDVFIDLWRTAGKYDPAKATESGWVAMLARRRLIDRMRKRQRMPDVESYGEEHDLPDERAQDVANAMDRTARAERARAVLTELPPAQRRMLELSLLDGKTHDEIARETNTPLGTVKSHIRRGLMRARDLLNGVGPTTDQDGGVS